MPLAVQRRLYRGNDQKDKPETYTNGYAKIKGGLRAKNFLANNQKDYITICCKCKYNTERCTAYSKTSRDNRCEYCALPGSKRCGIHDGYDDGDSASSRSSRRGSTSSKKSVQASPTLSTNRSVAASAASASSRSGAASASSRSSSSRSSSPRSGALIENSAWLKLALKKDFANLDVSWNKDAKPKNFLPIYLADGGRKGQGIFLSNAVKGKDMKVLGKKGWLNDQVITYFFLVLAKLYEKNNILFFNANFWRGDEVSGMDTKNFEKDFLIPANVDGNHWVLLYIKNREKEIVVYNSIENKTYTEQIKGVLKRRAWFKEREKDYTYVDPKCEQQDNTYDCGVFVCMNALDIARGQDKVCDKKKTEPFRSRIAQAILTGNLKERSFQKDLDAVEEILEERKKAASN